MMPWSPDVLTCDTDEPSHDWPSGKADYDRSRAIRLELEAAVRARRQAAQPPVMLPRAPDAAGGDPCPG